MKQRLRQEAKKRRAALDPATAVASSQAIAEQVLSLLDRKDPVLAYVAKPPEVDTRPLISALLARGTPVAVPVIERETCTLRISTILTMDVLVESTFHVPEPIGHEIPADPSGIPAILVPLVAFDRSGNRLGYGAGYYDRFLAANPHMRKIGIAFSCQETDTIPSDPFDIRMDCIVTENGALLCRNR
ncbi:MAG: 5-formyltetrahydrofolate cyclo-ligase [Methanoregulaceae archaeon]